METPKEGGVKRKWSTLVHYGPQYNNCVQSWAVLTASLIKVCSVFNAILATSPALYCYFFCFLAFLSAGNWYLFMPRFEVRSTTDLCGTQRETQNDSSHMQRSAFTYLCFCDFLSYDGWT